MDGVCAGEDSRASHYRGIHQLPGNLISQSNWWRRRLQCETCQLYMLAQSLRSHIKWKYGIYESFLLDQELSVYAPPITYYTYLSQPVNRFYCPVSGCTGNLANKSNPWNFCVIGHPDSLAHTPKTGCPPKCEHCELQVDVEAMSSRP